MHATYGFLVKASGATLQEKADDAVSIVASHLEHVGDENNWSQDELVVFEDGEMKALCSEGDWRGREGLQLDAAAVVQAERFKWAWDFCAECVAIDLDEACWMLRYYLGETPGNASAPTHPRNADVRPMAEVARTAATLLSDVYRTLVPDEVDPDRRVLILEGCRDLRQLPVDMTSYARLRVSSQLEYWLTATNRPFSSDESCTPYQFRCVDLSNRHDSEGMRAIVFVDIHT